jgi:adenylate cyclase
MAFPLPDKPSIAVMPFVNMTGDQNQDFFCDGLTESLIMALSKVPQLFVIARESTFSYKGKGAKISQVSEELGVQYVLEGSVQRTGDRVRVTAQLIDALKGHHLWSERYDRSVRDIFDLQDEITMKILTELQVKITAGQAAYISAKGTNNLQAYLKVLEADGYRNQNNKEANAVAMRLSQEAVELDPNYPAPHRILAVALLNDVLFGASKSPEETLSKAMKSAEKAVELAQAEAGDYAILSSVFLWMRQHDNAIEAAERAVELNPNSPGALFALAMCLNYSFRSEEALPLLRQAIRLNPFRTGYYHHFGIACRETGRYEEGIAALKKSLQLAPNDVIARIVLVSLYMYAGREDEARATVAEIERIDPNLSVARFARWTPWKEGPRRDRFFDALRQAGLK